MSTQYRVPSNDNYIRDLENISQRERHGLFTQPPPLVVGDLYNDALKSQGKERGVLVNKKMQKKHEPVVFSEPGYTTLGDPYKDPFKAQQIYDKERELAIRNPNSFKPNDKVKTVYYIPKCRKHSEYEHMKEFDDKKFNTRTPTGEVVTQARNFMTNPAKRGLGRTTIGNLFGNTEYVPDPYDRQEELERRERILHKSKFLPGTTRFVSTSHGYRPFTADHQLFDGAGYVNYTINSELPKSRKPPLYKGAPFRPANANKAGFQGTFEVLQHMEEGGPEPKTKQNIYQKLSQTQTYERPWKPNSNGTFERPCPSVQQKSRNRSAKSNQKF